MKKIKYIIPAITLASPLISFAATTKKLSDLIGSIAGYLNQALLLLMGVAVLMFVFYIVKYFIMPNEGGDGRTEAGKYLMWSLIGFFVILSMWGLVNIVTATFNLGPNTPGSWANLKNIFPN